MDHPSPSLPVIAMYKLTASYDQDFFLLEERTINRVRIMPKVYNLIETDAEGRPKTITLCETVLNWQIGNALEQNLLFHKIEHKVDTVNTNITHMANSFSNKVHGLEAVVQELQRKIEALHYLFQT